LKNARDKAKQIVCAGSLKQTALSSIMYIGDNNNYIYPAISTRYGNWLREWDQDVVGMGYLVRNDYIKSGDVFYCPSAQQVPSPHGWIVFFTSDAFKNTFFNAHAYVGCTYTYNVAWLADPNPSYQNQFDNRSTNYYKINPNCPASFPIIADSWINLSTNQYFVNHEWKGLNASYLDGHATWMVPEGTSKVQFITNGNVTCGDWMTRFWAWMKDNQ